MFPWAAVHRSWAIKKALTEGKGGKMKVYHSFCKHYVEKKGWSMLKADQHWQKRLADRSWRHGVDPEDTIASIWISGHTSHHQASQLTNTARLFLSFSLPLFLFLFLSLLSRRSRRRRRRRCRRRMRSAQVLVLDADRGADATIGMAIVVTTCVATVKRS